MSKITELLNARHQDLGFELAMLANNVQLAKDIAPKRGVETELESVINALQNHLVDKLGVDIEEIAEEEEIEVEEVDDSLIRGYIEANYERARSDLNSYNQFDTTIKKLKYAGALDEEVEKLYDFKKRLEVLVFDRYDVTEDDLKDLEEPSNLIDLDQLLEESNE